MKTSSVLRLAYRRRLRRLVRGGRHASTCCIAKCNRHRQVSSLSIGDFRTDGQSFSVSGHGVFSHFCDCCYRVVSATPADSLFSLHWQTAYRNLVTYTTCHQNTFVRSCFRSRTVQQHPSWVRRFYSHIFPDATPKLYSVSQNTPLTCIFSILSEKAWKMLTNTFQRQLISSSSYLGNGAYTQQFGKNVIFFILCKYSIQKRVYNDRWAF